MPGVFQAGVPCFFSQDGEASKAKLASRRRRLPGVRLNRLGDNGGAAVWIKGLAGFMFQFGW